MTNWSVRSGLGGGPDSEILAAGAVLYRHAAGGIEVALIHRRRHDDWTFPKGKLEPGEHVIAAAVREVTEETGIRPVLGRPLATVRYRVDGRPKRVDYWAALPDARSLGAPFVPNNEVDDLEWLPPAEAATRLTYAHDLRLLDLLSASSGAVGFPPAAGAPPRADNGSITAEGGPGAMSDDIQVDETNSGVGDGSPEGQGHGGGQIGSAGSPVIGGDPSMGDSGSARAVDGGQAGYGDEAGHGNLAGRGNQERHTDQAEQASRAGQAGQAERADQARLAGQAGQAELARPVSPAGQADQARPASQAEQASQAVPAGQADQAGRGGRPNLTWGDTVPCILLRHASAGHKDTWPGDDLLRPLDGQGVAEAQTLVGLLDCYAPARVISSAAERCQGTVRPYAERIGTAIETEPVFSVQPDDGEDLRAAAQGRMTELIAHPSPMVICAHRENISALLDRVRTTLPTPAVPTPGPDDPAWRDVEPHNSSKAADWSPPKGGFWVLHIANGQLSALEHHDLTT